MVDSLPVIFSLVLLVLVFIGLALAGSRETPVEKASAYVLELSSYNFKQEVDESKLPVVIKFYASWCGPCQRLAPHMERVALEYAGRIKFVKVNVELHKDLVARFSVKKYPTLVLLKAGKLVNVQTGYQSLTELRGLCDYLLK